MPSSLEMERDSSSRDRAFSLSPCSFRWSRVEASSGCLEASGCVGWSVDMNPQLVVHCVESVPGIAAFYAAFGGVAS